MPATIQNFLDCSIFLHLGKGLVHSSEYEYLKQIFPLQTKSGCGQNLYHETTKIVIKAHKIGTGRGGFLAKENSRSKTDEEEEEGKGSIYWRRKIKFNFRSKKTI